MTNEDTVVTIPRKKLAIALELLGKMKEEIQQLKKLQKR